MTALKHLKEMALEYDRKRYPNTPVRYLAPPKYSDKNGNTIAKAIIDFLKFNKFHCERIAVTGRQVDTRQTYTDAIGRTRTIGSVKWIKSSMQTGTADLSATIRGLSVKIEIKCAATNDRIQSKSQKQYQKQIEQSGGIYLIIRDFEQFYHWYNHFMKTDRT